MAVAPAAPLARLLAQHLSQHLLCPEAHESSETKATAVQLCVSVVSRTKCPPLTLYGWGLMSHAPFVPALLRTSVVSYCSVPERAPEARIQWYGREAAATR